MPTSRGPCLTTAKTFPKLRSTCRGTGTGISPVDFRTASVARRGYAGSTIPDMVTPEHGGGGTRGVPCREPPIVLAQRVAFAEGNTMSDTARLPQEKKSEEGEGVVITPQGPQEAQARRTGRPTAGGTWSSEARPLPHWGKADEKAWYKTFHGKLIARTRRNCRLPT